MGHRSASNYFGMPIGVGPPFISSYVTYPISTGARAGKSSFFLQEVGF